MVSMMHWTRIWFSRQRLGRALILGWLAWALPLQAAPRSMPNFNLLDVRGDNHELRRAEGKAVVLFFTGTGCPIARKSTPKLKALKRRFGPKGVTFWIINAYADDTRRDAEKEYRELGLWGFTYLLDPKQGVGLALGIERTAEVVAIDTKSWHIFYQGAIDDQFAEGAERPQNQSGYLETALTEFLAGRPVTTERTPPRGCRISYVRMNENDGTPDYATQVAPLLERHCVECHRDGGIGPWRMNRYGRVANYADMIEEVLLTRRMPPWDPDPEFGEFKNGRRLTREETQTLLRWIQAGAPRGSGPDPLEAPLPPLPDWRLGKPDFVLRLPKPQQVPATGVLDYRYIKVPTPFTNEVWLSAVDVKPDNRKVVHHAILYAKWPGGKDDGTGHGVFMVGWAPGARPLSYPDGVAKRMPANAELTVEMHYTTCGSPQTDQSEIALYLAPGPQARQAETRLAGEFNLNIPPGSDEARQVAVYPFTKPATLYGLFPHMHYRGKWMRYELLLPNGKRETLLHVPRYDFQWQLSYYLKQPRHIPAGAWLMVTGAFDNSPDNPANPDASRRVTFGLQSWDEMFIGFFEAADDPSSGIKEPAVLAPVSGGGL
jgi:peroxiredoxin